MRFVCVKRLARSAALVAALVVGAIGPFAVAGAGEASAQGQEVEFDGVVETMPATGLVGSWQVSGTVVHVTEATQIDQELGPLAVGVHIEVEGAAQPDGSITASELEVEVERD